MNKQEYIESQFAKVNGSEGAIKVRSGNGSSTHWIILDAQTIKEIEQLLIKSTDKKAFELSLG